VATEREPRNCSLGRTRNLATPECPRFQAALVRAAVHCELTGSDEASARGLTVHNSSPVLALCRRLLALGINPQTPVHCYRGPTLALRIRSIGEAAGLEINSSGTGFIKRRARVRPAPPMHLKGRGRSP
jgi:Fe2+ transport system protein FeoA